MIDFDLSLYLVTDRSLSNMRPIERIVEEAVKGGVTMVQLREKNCCTNDFVKLAIRLKQILKQYNVPLIINDRLDIVLAADAEGLHIGQSDMPYPIARKILGYNKIIGLSVETIAQAKDANLLDVDYIGISPVFFTGTKTDIQTPLGLEGIREIASFTKHHIVGIGGIHAGNAKAVIEAGAAGVAVVSAIVSADDPAKAALVIKQQVEEYRNACLGIVHIT
jgi:thiamine-phosphate pyrophosphorylase